MASNVNKKENRAVRREDYKNRYRVFKELRIWLAVFLVICIGLSLWACFTNEKTDYREETALYNDKYSISAMTLSYLFYSEFYATIEDESFYTDGFGTYGLDPAKPLREQKYTELRSFYNELMNTASAGALTTLQYYTMAMENGVVLEEAEEKLIKAEMADIASDAKAADMSVDEYLDYRYCPGMREADLREALELYYLATKQYDALIDSALNCTDEEIEEYYDKHTDDFLNVNLIKYEMDIELDENGEAEEEYVKRAEVLCECETAEELFEKMTADMKAEGMEDEAIEEQLEKSVITAATDTYDGDLKEWLFDYSRKRGDARIFYSGESCAVFWIMRSAGRYIYPSVNCRVIYVDGGTFETEAAAEAKAKEILGLAEAEPTEANFESLVYEHSQDEGTVPYGGLCEGVVPGDLNYKCEEWVFAVDRQVGDIGMVELEGNYYILYLSGLGDPCWHTIAERTLIDEKVGALEETMANFTDIKQNAEVIDNLIRDDLATERGADFNRKEILLIVFVGLSVLVCAATVGCFVYTARLKSKYGYKF